VYIKIWWSNWQCVWSNDSFSWHNVNVIKIVHKFSAPALVKWRSKPAFDAYSVVRLWDGYELLRSTAFPLCDFSHWTQMFQASLVSANNISLCAWRQKGLQSSTHSPVSQQLLNIISQGRFKKATTHKPARESNSFPMLFLRRAVLCARGSIASNFYSVTFCLTKMLFSFFDSKLNAE
jgi:hypothetical protein